MPRCREPCRDVQSEQLEDLEQHQLRRPIVPIRTPRTTAPAKAPSGLRRTIFSTSPANPLACSVAAEAMSAPRPATSLATLPTCPATFDVISRADFEASLPACEINFIIVSFRLLRSF